jgi:hypothetical protein
MKWSWSTVWYDISIFLPHPDGLESIQVLPVRSGRGKARERDRGRERC